MGEAINTSKFLRFFCLLCCLEIMAVGNLSAQHYRFKSITVNENLSHPNVMCFVQDSLGYVWIGTNNGLDRYDGYRVETYKYKLEDPQSIPGNRVKSMIVDRSGQIWLFLETKGLFRFYPDKMLFTAVSLPFPMVGNLGMELDDRGHLWLNGKEYGLCQLKLNQDGSIRESQTFPPETIVGSGSKLNISLLTYGNGHLFFLNQTNEIWTCQTTTGHFQRRFSSSELPIAETERINELRAEQGMLWVGTTEKLFGIRNPLGIGDSMQFQMVDLRSEHTTINHIWKDHQERLWLGTTNGLMMLEIQAKETGNLSPIITHYQNGPIGQYRILSQTSTALFEDRFGVLWVGTQIGVNYANLKQKAFVYLAEVPKPNMPVQNNIVHAIYKDKKKEHIWMGLSSGLRIYDIKTKAFLSFPDQSVLSTIRTTRVAFIFKNNKGDIWLGMKNNGLFRLRSGQAFEAFESIPVNAEDGSNLLIRLQQMAEDSEGRLWITTHSNGAIILDPNNLAFRHLLHEPENTNSLSTSNLTDVYADPKDSTIWVSTRDGGLNSVRWDDSGQLHFQHSLYQQEDSNSLSSNHTWQILRAFNDRLWVTTLGGGLNEIIEWGETEKKFRRYSVQDGLKDNDIESIAEDNEGNLWLGGVGLTRFNPETGDLEHFDYQDGLQSNHFLVGSVHKDTDGILYFGGGKGLNYFDPEEIVPDNIIPKVLITAWHINNQEVKPGVKVGKRILLDEPLSETKGLRLKAHENDFVFDFVGLQFASPEENRYKYRLKGLKNNWTYTRYPNLSANYSNVPPGDYVFEVRASNGDGVWNPNAANLSIHVARPWYGSILAFVIYGVLGVLFLYLFQRNVQKQARLQNELLFAEKEKELSQSKISFFTNISHELRTPLTLIKGPLEELLHQSKLRHNTKEKLKVIQNSTNRLLGLVNQLLDFRKMESGNMQLQAAHGNFGRFVHELFLVFSRSVNRKEIDFHFYNSSSELPLSYDRDKMEIVLMNLLSNAYKYTKEQGVISLRLSIKGSEWKEAVFDDEKEAVLLNNYLQIEIRDDGIGMKEAEIKNIFNPYFQVKNAHTLGLMGTGIGLSLVKGIVQLHRGEVWVESELGKGATFFIKLPFGQAHLSEYELISNFKNSDYLDAYLKAEQTEESEPEIQLYLDQLEERDHPYHILVVEDNAALRTYISQCLGKKFRISLAHNGQEGLERVQLDSPDLVISDVMMPVMDGIKMCEQIKANELTAHIPVILLTARTSTVYEKEGLSLGAEAYITKPFNVRLLISRINSILRNRERVQEFYRKQLFLEPIHENHLSPEEKLTHRAIQFIEERLDDPDFNVQKLAEGLGLSQSGLYRKIKQTTHKSLVEFIRDVRLRKAAQLLQHGDLSVAEIAYLVGFNDLKYFRSHFKKLYQVNPSEFAGKY